MQKVNLTENRQHTGVKMVNDIVSDDNFQILSESNNHFPFKLRFNFYVQAKTWIRVKRMEICF